MSQQNNIEVIEKRLWKAADTLRANSELASNEYFLPVMGLIFLRHAYSRFLSVRDDIIANLPRRGGKTRALTKEDFSQKNAIFLDDKAQFDYLITLTDADDRGNAIIEAMESIERDYTNLKGQLPKQEYRNIPGDVLKILLNTLSPDELKTASGDIFGRIYEYFLTQFADQGAHVALGTTVKTAITKLQKEWTGFQKRLKTLQKTWKPEQYYTAKKLNRFTGENGELKQLSTQNRELVRQLAHTSKQTISLIDLCEKELGAKKHTFWENTVINGNRSASLKKAVESFRNEATEQLKQVDHLSMMNLKLIQARDLLLPRMMIGEIKV